MATRTHNYILMTAAAILTLALLWLNGCGKESEPEAPAAAASDTQNTETAAAQTQTTEQTLCPVMGQPIDKELFTEYKGKKVYFCCPGCKEVFEKDPEKYIEKLPQFN